MRCERRAVALRVGRVGRAEGSPRLLEPPLPVLVVGVVHERIVAEEDEVHHARHEEHHQHAELWGRPTSVVALHRGGEKAEAEEPTQGYTELQVTEKQMTMTMTMSVSSTHRRALR